jgi:NAD+ synthase (glutamine-hydrolysing)
VIPEAILDKAPSAELKDDQVDQDALPPYPVLDAILHHYVEMDDSRDAIVAMGFPAAIVDRVIRLTDSAEYKRRQGPLGVRITTKAFGRDRRMPVTNGFGG